MIKRIKLHENENTNVKEIRDNFEGALRDARDSVRLVESVIDDISYITSTRLRYNPQDLTDSVVSEALEIKELLEPMETDIRRAYKLLVAIQKELNVQ